MIDREACGAGQWQAAGGRVKEQRQGKRNGWRRRGPTASGAFVKQDWRARPGAGGRCRGNPDPLCGLCTQCDHRS
eukprot:scaffold345801_cov47-Prasinocladus_malaysianus.AAC.1